jgi:hypothetical protein
LIEQKDNFTMETNARDNTFADKFNAYFNFFTDKFIILHNHLLTQRNVSRYPIKWRNYQLRNRHYTCYSDTLRLINLEWRHCSINLSGGVDYTGNPISNSFRYPSPPLCMIHVYFNCDVIRVHQWPFPLLRQTSPYCSYSVVCSKCGTRVATLARLHVHCEHHLTGITPLDTVTKSECSHWHKREYIPIAYNYPAISKRLVTPLNSAHRMYLCVLYGSHNKQRVFP